MLSFNGIVGIEIEAAGVELEHEENAFKKFKVRKSFVARGKR